VPVFEYEALAADGSRTSGIMDAENEAAVRARLKSSGHYPVTISETGAGRRGIIDSFNDWLRLKRISSSELNVFTRQLATLIGAGIPVDAALSSIVDQIDNPGLKRIVAQLGETLSQGESLSQALQAHPDLFSPMYVNMIRAGEAFGSLDLVLSSLADFGDRFEAVRSRLRAALIYPSFMVVVGIGVLFVLITFVVPDIMQVYAKMEKALPLPTRMLIGTGTFLQNYWWLLLAAGVALGFGFSKAMHKPIGRRIRDRLLLKSPVIGRTVQKNVLFKFSSTLENLLKSGVDIIAALEISKRVVDNVCITEVIDEAIEEIRVGRSMVAPFANSEWFPSTVVQMMAVGESSGTLEEMLAKISQASERELEAATLGITALIEPLLIVIMGILVGFIVLSILLPIFEMNQVIG
jgi:general secretion pathway protein F